ncbi:MAG: flagellar filament capping protein FliD [Sinimarinibacterium sp.]|jgi:flagellar hook-associated protein 2
MAISAAGVGSGLDIAGMVSQLVSAERAPVAQRISAARSTLNTQLSALGALKGALSSLQAKAELLTGGGKLDALKMTSSLPEVFTATAGSDAAAGSYEVEVVELAKAHKLASGAYAGGSGTVLGNGSVEISVGGGAFTVTLSDGNNTLAALRDAINAAEDNTGVSATLVNEAGGTRLLLTSDDSGTESQLVVTTGLLSFTEKQAATDAHIRVEGYDIYSQSNTVTDAVDGVTFNLLKASPGDIGTLSLTRDVEAGKAAIEDFAKAYSTVVSLIGVQTRYDADNKRAATFTGDAGVRGVMQTLRSIVGGSAAGGALSVLSEIGITTKADGTLIVDSSKLTEALEADPRAVETLFAGADGFATRLTATIEQMLGDSGQLDAKTDSANARLKDLTQQEDALARRMESLEARYTRQFTALDSLIAQMNATSSYLTQQLSALSNMG